ncbi:MAG: leucine-rich repeat protein, partial [Clostridia bacterium]|nr:leucine-rich repeat protein [Clostridia bacterium]
YADNGAGDYEIVKYVPNSVSLTSITLPEKANDRFIVGIAENAFKAENSLKSVVIPATYSYIGDYAFYDCDSLETVTIEERKANENGEREPGMESIGKSAFESCDVLTNFKMPIDVKVVSEFMLKDCKAIGELDLSNIETIEKGAFFGCSALKKVTVSDKITSATKEAFYNCDALVYNVEGNLCYLGNDANKTVLLVKAADANIEKFAISNTTKVVSDYAFNDCALLTSITLSDSVKTVKGSAVAECEALKYNESENGLYLGTAENPYMVLIGVKATAVEDFKLNKATKIIVDTAFDGCTILEDISFEGTADEWNAVSKIEKWNGDLTVNVKCSDKIIEVLG